MKREVTNKIGWFLDNVLPPIIRDSRLFMYPLMKILFKDNVSIFMNFKENVLKMSFEKYLSIYKETRGVHLKRESDMNKKCIKYILNNIVGQSVLDVGCGSGYLLGEIKRIYPDLRVIGVDINPGGAKSRKANNCIYMNVEKVDFNDNSFDTVVCAHTLEHILNIEEAVKELRRVTKSKLIVVLPRQRNYKYTFDLHIHFFYYKYDVIKLFKPDKDYKLFLLGGDWIYVEDYEE